MEEKKDNIVSGEGTVVFLNRNMGSKSEGIYPYLYQNKDNCEKIRLDHDNPFENKGLLPYDGKMVRIAGCRGRSGTILISEINIIYDPSADR